ncbi:MAG: GyrI-like domain-containing protein [Chloroflexota bacterium]
MEKIDFKKELKHLYKPSAKKVETIDVPEINFLMVDGKGNPGTSIEYAHAVESLFSLSYTLKFMIKKGELAIDYGVLPLEGMWWADDMSDFIEQNKSNWKWTMMIMQPEFITLAMVDEARGQVKKKKKDLATIDEVRFSAYAEGKAAQTLHIGPFADEGPTIARVHEYIEESGYQLSGKHHEIYLTDIRRAAPEKWRTIIRQPMIEVRG